MNSQGILFREYLDPIRLKEGKSKCPCCGKLMRAYCKTMDKRLVQLGYDILDYLEREKRMLFKPADVWGNEADTLIAHRKICDVNKLHYWKLIESLKGGWTLTRKGFKFLTGRIQVPKSIWVFNDEVVLEDDTMVHVGNVDERWQVERSDYTFDYIPQKYETEFII